jgi:Holliday junction resolvase-like predicted endonuclease
VAWEGDVLVFVEVKSLRSGAPPEDAVGFRKQQRIIRAARSYMSSYRLHHASYRFDILSVNVRIGCEPEFRLLRDAFREGEWG